MFFHALTFARSWGSCFNMRPLGWVFKLLPRDPANVNALKQTCLIVILHFIWLTGDSRYVDFAYLDTITYVEVIFHSQHFFSIYLCISTPSMSKTVNMKQRISRGDFSCPRRIFYYICYCVCRSQNSTLARASYCLLRLCICINWGAKIFQTMVKNN